MTPHARAEARSVRLHAAVAERLVADEKLVARARERVDRWLRDGTVARLYAEAWSRLLAGPRETLLAALVEPSERMHDLRQVSPFAGVLDARSRWRLLRDGEADR